MNIKHVRRNSVIDICLEPNQPATGHFGLKTLRGTRSEVSGHFGPSAEVSD